MRTKETYRKKIIINFDVLKLLIFLYICVYIDEMKNPSFSAIQYIINLFSKKLWIEVLGNFIASKAVSHFN